MLAGLFEADDLFSLDIDRGNSVLVLFVVFKIIQPFPCLQSEFLNTIVSVLYNSIDPFRNTRIRHFQGMNVIVELTYVELTLRSTPS